MTTKKATPSKAKPKPRKKDGKATAKASPAAVPKKTPKKTKAKAPAKAKTPARSAKGKAAKAQPAPELHWLVRPETIRKLWVGGGAVLAVLVVLQAWVETHGYFGLDGTFSFNAWYGFVTCVAMIVGAKGLGAFLKREDTYYGAD